MQHIDFSPAPEKPREVRFVAAERKRRVPRDPPWTNRSTLWGSGSREGSVAEGDNARTLDLDAERL
jgi:hypothetical protein